MKAGSGERGRDWERDREWGERKREMVGVREILAMISGVMQDGEYNREG